MSSLFTFDNPVTAVLLTILLVLIVLMVALPSVIVVSRKVVRVPFRAKTLSWMYVAWALAMTSGLTLSIAAAGTTSVEGASAGNFTRLAFLILTVFVILAVGLKYRFAFVTELTSGVLAIFFAFALWSLSTVLWSVLTAVTLYKAFEYLVMLLLFAYAVYLIRVNARGLQNQLLALKSLFNWHWFLLLLLLINVYLGLLIWPQYALSEYAMMGDQAQPGTLRFALQGVFPTISANSVGELGAILGVIAFARILLGSEYRLLYLPVFGISIVTMILAQSRSSMLGFFAGLVVVLIVSRRFGVLAASMGFAAVVLPSYFGVAYTFLRRGQTDEAFYSLSSRTTWWATSLEAFRESPIGGHGAWAGGRDVLGVSAHDTYVEAALDTGVIGLALLVLGLLATWIWLFKLRSVVESDPIGRLLWVESLGVFSILMVRSVFSVPFIWTQILTLGLLLIFISVVKRQARQNNFEAAPATQTWITAQQRSQALYHPGSYRRDRSI